MNKAGLDLKTLEALQSLVESGLTLEDVEAITMNYVKTQSSQADTRYNTPKEAPKASEADIDKTIMETEIYRRAKLAIMGAQRKQVAYGIDKYPEPLNANTWDIIETIDHIIDESIDKLHYLTMLRIKFEQLLVEEKTEKLPDGFVDYFRNINNPGFDVLSKAGADLDGDIIRVVDFDKNPTHKLVLAEDEPLTYITVPSGVKPPKGAILIEVPDKEDE